MRYFLLRILEVIGLQTARGRIMFFLVVSLVIFSTPYSVLSGLSIWQRLGIDSPSIGLTRAYWHILHLEFVAAWHRNPLIYAVLVLGLPLLARDAYMWLRKK